jgi:RNA polymerase sigma-B factor
MTAPVDRTASALGDPLFSAVEACVVGGSGAGASTVPPGADAGVRTAGPTGYENLARLFAERAGLRSDDPRRNQLRAELIAGYLPVARHIARRYAHRVDNAEELEQVAAVGLVLAVDRFDPGREVDFLSFAVPTMNGEVLRYFRDRANMIRTPRRLRTLQSMIYQAAAELGQRHGRAPRPSQIAEHLDMDLAVVLEALAAQGVAHTASLDEPSSGENDSGHQSRFDTALAQVEKEFDLVEYREALTPLLAALPDRERRILLLRFFGGLTQTEIGTQIGISQMHVSRLLSRTLSRLRRGLATD